LANNQNSNNRGTVAINGPPEMEEEDCDIQETVEMVSYPLALKWLNMSIINFFKSLLGKIGRNVL